MLKRKSKVGLTSGLRLGAVALVRRKVRLDPPNTWGTPFATGLVVTLGGKYPSTTSGGRKLKLCVNWCTPCCSALAVARSAVALACLPMCRMPPMIRPMRAKMIRIATSSSISVNPRRVLRVIEAPFDQTAPPPCSDSIIATMGRNIETDDRADDAADHDHHHGFQAG
jgi:hypothetical protein